ncbi:MAG: hypothetical protein KG003_01725 [Bacteroidetes bacterium]|nr:hypothetical protein [Bacteroidota bacterium]
MENRELHIENKSGEKKFGNTIGVILLIFGVYFWYKKSDVLGDYLIIIGGVFLGLAYYFPVALRPLNKAWFYFGMWLQKITNPIILGFVFFVLIFPVALIRKLFGKGIKRKFSRNQAESYWKQREKDTVRFETIF